MLVIRYTAPNELEIAGDESGLRFVSDGVKRIWSTPGATLRVVAQVVADPTPYSRSLQMLRIRVDEGLLHALVIGEHLIVTGNTSALEAFCGSFDAVAAGGPGSHHHLKYYDGHPRIEPKSLPLVVRHA